MKTGIQKVTAYSLAVMRWAMEGCPERDSAEVDRLMAICRACDKYADGQCAECGCRVSDDQPAIINKIRMATEECSKWR